MALLVVFAISKLFNRFQASDILDIAGIVGGKTLKIIISIAYIILFLIITLITLRYITEFLKLIYFQNLSIIFLSLLFLVPMAISVQKGIKSISKVNLFVTILSFITIFILFIGSVSRFVPQRALPIFGTGIDKVLFTNLTNIFAFSGIAYLMFLMPLLKNTKEFKQIAIISVVLSSIYLFISVMCLLFVFAFMTMTQDLFSVFLLTRIVEYAPILERTDAIYIFFWLFCILSFLSANLFFIVQSFGKITKLKNSNAMIFNFCAIILGITIIVDDVSIYYVLYNSIFTWFFIILIAISIILLLLANIKDRKKL